jgi:hypothetical protein
MQTPDAITPDTVQRACRALEIRDWTSLTEAKVLPDEAQRIQQAVGGEALQISADEFRQGLEVELEHGIRFPDANVTNNHPILTGMIVLAHLKETLDYYYRLDVAELEGDLLKASRKGNSEKVNAVYKKLLAARKTLAEKELAET